MTAAIVRPAAAADIEFAYRWYEQKRPGLGAEFLTSLRHTMAIVLEYPESAPILYRGVRRALVRNRFPYGVFYQVRGDKVVVIACLHVRRHPQRMASRVDR